MVSTNEFSEHPVWFQNNQVQKLNDRGNWFFKEFYCRYEQFGNMPRMYQKNEENEVFLSKGLKEETHVYVLFFKILLPPTCKINYVNMQHSIC